MIRRTHHDITTLDRHAEGDYMSDVVADRTTPVPSDIANVISSRIDRDGNDAYGPTMLHAPVLDIDFPVFAIPSSTPGHYHLYLEREVPWAQYEALLKALAAAGIIEEGYAHASIERGATFVRKPDVLKPGSPYAPPPEPLDAETAAVLAEHPF